MIHNDREMTLDEWCEQLSEWHLVRRELRELRWREDHPIRWALQRLWFRIRRALRR